MYKYCLLLLFICAGLKVCASPTKIYYDKNWQETKKKDATWYRIYTLENGIYELEDHFIDGPIYMTGFSTTLTSNNKRYRVGSVIFYDHDGHKTREGNYDKGSRWKYYYRGSDALMQERYGGNDTSYTLIYDSTTRKLRSKSARRDSTVSLTWTYTDHDTIYSEDLPRVRGNDTSVTFTKFLGSTIKRKEYFNHKKGSVEATCYDEAGKIVPCDNTKSTFTYVEQMPKTLFNIQQYISKSLHYPKEARAAGIEGRVKIRFVVDDEGAVCDATVIDGIGHGCDEEALRVVSEMPYWEPGMQNGMPVNVYFTLPITFALR